jgi:hypothetical protein
VPFVRFSRDRRGYEHVYLVDSTAERGGRTRLIYWFRTPPGVKVGRSPFDSDTQRRLEHQNPGVKFDWPQIVAARMPPPAPVENWREKRRAERAIKRARATEAAEAAGLERTAGEGEDLAAGELEDGTGSVELMADEQSGSEEEAPESMNARTGEPPAGQTDAEQGGPGPPPAGMEVGAPPRRGRRRRRRRGRRPADRPLQAEPGADPNGRLDPAEPPPEPSDER